MFKKEYSKEQQEEIKNLLATKKYLELCLKYGLDPFSKKNNKRNKEEIKETGKLKVKKSTKYKGKFLKELSIDLLILYVAGNNLITISSNNSIEKETKQNAIDYADEINDYEEKINNYATYVNSLDLNDFEKTVKVMADIRNNIGYGSPERNLLGYMRLEIDETGEYGVCRNMADDMASKLNAINPDYNARIVMCDVKALDSSNLRLLNLNTLPAKEETPSGDKEDLLTKYFSFAYGANHAIVAFNMPGEEETLLADPTNPSYGVMAECDLLMFNSIYDENNNRVNSSTDYNYRIPANIIYTDKGMDNLGKLYGGTFISDGKLDELNEKYGLKAQEEAYQNILKIEDSEYVTGAFYHK